jgi:hypothetical protein
MTQTIKKGVFRKGAAAFGNVIRRTFDGLEQVLFTQVCVIKSFHQFLDEKLAG